MNYKELIGKECCIVVKDAMASEGNNPLRYIGKIVGEGKETIHLEVEAIKISVYGKELRNIEFKNVVINKAYIIAIEY